MIKRDFYRLPELAAKWGCTTNAVLHLAETGRLRLAVKLNVPQGAGKVRVTVAELSGRYKIETLPLDVMLDHHKGLFWMCLDEVVTLVATSEVDISRAYTLDGDLALFKWPPGTGFRVRQEDVVVRSRDAEEAREAETGLSRAFALIRERHAADASAEGKAAMALLDSYSEAQRAWGSWLQVPIGNGPRDALLWEQHEHDRRHRRDDLGRRIDAYANGLSGSLLDEPGPDATDAVALPAPMLQQPAPVRPKKAPELHGERILAAIRKRGLDPLSLAPPPLGNKPWKLREELSRELNLSVPQLSKAFTLLRKDQAIKHSTPHPTPHPAPK